MGHAASPALLVLEDGTAYSGRSVGAAGERACELVFNTAMSGYQEILTDPSYCGQGVVMTYPQIGNTGVNDVDCESTRCWAEAFVMRQMSPLVSNYRAQQSLGDYLIAQGIPAIDGIDTRDLTLRLRNHGALRAVISTESSDVAALHAQAQAHPSLDGRDLAQVVTCKEPYTWSEGIVEGFPFPRLAAETGERIPIVAYDFGIKRNILRALWQAGFAPTVVPAQTTAEEVLGYAPQGVFLSNGPGDPAAVTYAHQNVKRLSDEGLPIFGICLGHQLLAHVFGGSTKKMKFGHHGANHPVQDLADGRVDITSQNHSFEVDSASLAGTGLEVSHTNPNDGCVEGLRHAERPVFSVQYHPEACPGPHDADHLFARFRALIQQHAQVPANG